MSVSTTLTSPSRVATVATAESVSDQTRRDAGLSAPDLWLRYFELGGMSTLVEMESYLLDQALPSAHDHDLLAHALNERFFELGREQTVRYDQIAGLPVASTPHVGPVLLRLLGSFSLSIDSQPVVVPMSVQRLVCFLALHDGPLLRQHVAGSLWGDGTEHHANGSLRSALWRLGDLAHPIVETDRSRLGFAPGIAVDLRASQALAHRVLDDAQELSQADLDHTLLSEDLLPDWTEDWVLVQREHHTQLRLRALEALCRRLTAMRRFGQAVQAGMLAVSVEPLRESAQRVLVSAHIAEGNVAAAAKQCDLFRALLRDELGLEPSIEMQVLVEELNR
jgi:DNA-binding SARP family transcriptional activator